MQTTNWTGAVSRPVYGHSTDDFFANRYQQWLTRSRAFCPAVSTRQNTDSYQIELVAPGLEEQDFQISVNDDCLTVNCRCESKGGRKPFGRAGSRAFSRSFGLPAGLRQNQLTTSYKNGILRIRVPR